MKIKLVDRPENETITTIFIEMLLKAGLDKDEVFMGEMRNSENVAEVILTINGREFPFAETVVELIKSEYAELDRKATERAYEIIKDSGLEEITKISEMIRDNRFHIKNKLEEITGFKINDEDDY